MGALSHNELIVLKTCGLQQQNKKNLVAQAKTESSLRVTFLQLKKLPMGWIHFSTFSQGKRASHLSESNSIPANISVVEGPNVLSEYFVL
jgi:hypothetical protein